MILLGFLPLEEEPPTQNPPSGGGGCSYNENYDWNCSEWSECVNELQTRECKLRNNCGNSYGRPETERTCVVETSESAGEGVEESEENRRRPGITGAVIGDYLSTGGGIVSILALLIALTGIGYFGFDLVKGLKKK